MFIILWIISVIAAIFLRYVFEPSSSSLLFISIFSALLVFSYLLEQKKFGGMRHNFLGILYVVFFMLNFSLRGIVLSSHSAINNAPYYLDDNSLIQAMLYALLGLGFFLLGFHVKNTFLKAESWGHYIFDRDFSTAGLYLFSIIGAISMLVASLVSFSTSYLTTNLSSIPSQIGTLGLISTLIILFQDANRASMFRIAWCAFCLLIFAASYFILGMRWALAFVFLYVVFYLLLTKGSIGSIIKGKGFWILAVITVLLFILLFPVMSIYKGYLGSSFFSKSPSERLEMAVDIYRGIAIGSLPNKDRNDLSYFFDNLSRRTGTGLDSLSILIANTPDIWEFQYGKTFLLGFLAPIPRFLWPSKPETSLEGEFYEKYLGMSRLSGRGGAGYTTVGDFWLNFHLPGIIVGMFLFGILLRFFQCFCIASEDAVTRAGGIVFLLISSPYLVDTTRSISAMVSGLFGLIIIPFFFLLLISRKRAQY
ncbi:MAG: hypothetical protein HPY71_14505 [Firmicutes bacterium]|nr:hypothetical protein [Bacillota bacterium]